MEALCLVEAGLYKNFSILLHYSESSNREYKLRKDSSPNLLPILPVKNMSEPIYYIKHLQVSVEDTRKAFGS